MMGNGFATRWCFESEGRQDIDMIDMIEWADDADKYKVHRA